MTSQEENLPYVARSMKMDPDKATSNLLFLMQLESGEYYSKAINIYFRWLRASESQRKNFWDQVQAAKGLRKDAKNRDKVPGHFPKWSVIRDIIRFFLKHRAKNRLKHDPLASTSLYREINSHCFEAAVQQAVTHIENAWKARKKYGKHHKPPKKRRFFKLCWQADSISIDNNSLLLKRMHGQNPIIIPWKGKPLPNSTEITFNRRNKKYSLHASFQPSTNVEGQYIPIKGTLAGIDLGEIHPAVLATKDTKGNILSLILSGRSIRSIKQLRHKLLATYSSKIDKMKKGSKRRKKAIAKKLQRLDKLSNWIQDAERKQAARAVQWMMNHGVETARIGELTGIRERSSNKGKKTNQKIHSWSFSGFSLKLQSICNRFGIKIEKVSEVNTSRTCPACLTKKESQVSGRTFACQCGFRSHRDAVGATNILLLPEDRKQRNPKGKTADSNVTPLGSATPVQTKDAKESGSHKKASRMKPVNSRAALGSVPKSGSLGVHLKVGETLPGIDCRPTMTLIHGPIRVSAIRHKSSKPCFVAHRQLNERLKGRLKGTSTP